MIYFRDNNVNQANSFKVFGEGDTQQLSPLGIPGKTTAAALSLKNTDFKVMDKSMIFHSFTKASWTHDQSSNEMHILAHKSLAEEIKYLMDIYLKVPNTLGRF